MPSPCILQDSFLLLLSLLGANVDLIKAGCPSDWLSAGGSCFSVVTSQHISLDGFPTLYHARETCRDKGGDLGLIGDIKTELEIYRLLQNSSQTFVKKLYIGLNDLQVENKFVWFDGSEPRYTHWMTDEPNNLYQGDEDCTAVKFNEDSFQNHNGLWDSMGWQDYPCCHNSGIQHALCYRDPITDDEREASPSEIDPDAEPQQHGAVQILAEKCKDETVCHFIPELKNIEPFNNTRNFSLGERVTLDCTQGFWLSDKSHERTYTCRYDGWSSFFQACSEVKCPPVPVWLGILTNSSHRDRQPYGSVVAYTCREGLRFQNLTSDDLRLAECNNSGIWEPDFEECFEPVSMAEFLRTKEPQEAEGAVYVGTFGLAFICCELTVIVILDLNSMRLHLTFAKRNIAHRLRSLARKADAKPQANAIELT